MKKMAAASFKEKLIDYNCTSKKIGNTYTASVFFGIASLIDCVGGRGALSPGKQITVFSNGSGALFLNVWANCPRTNKQPLHSPNHGKGPLIFSIDTKPPGIESSSYPNYAPFIGQLTSERSLNELSMILVILYHTNKVKQCL